MRRWCRYKEEHDIILPFRYIYLRIQDSWPHYYMPLAERINLILNYILKKNIHGGSKLLEEAKSYKYDSTPVTTSSGYKVIPHDWTNVLRMLGQEYGKMLATMERHIWSLNRQKIVTVLPGLDVYIMAESSYFGLLLCRLQIL